MRFAIVAVVKVAPVPLAIVGLEVLERLVEQTLSKLLGMITRNASSRQFALIKVSGTDGERTEDGLHILIKTCIRV